MPRYLVQELAYIDHYIIADDENAAYEYVNDSATGEVLQAQEIPEDEAECFPAYMWEEV